MNEPFGSTKMEQSDTKYFSQRAKHISLLNKQSPCVLVKPSLSEMYFKFSNRTYKPVTDTQLASTGRGHGNSIINDHQHKSISVGRGRTPIPSSPFVSQKDDRSPSSTSIATTTVTTISNSTTTTTMSSPIFVMHDEVQFVRPYFGPPSNNDTQVSLTAHKREVLLSALKEIETGLKKL